MSARGFVTCSHRWSLALTGLGVTFLVGMIWAPIFSGKIAFFELLLPLMCLGGYLGYRGHRVFFLLPMLFTVAYFGLTVYTPMVRPVHWRMTTTDEPIKADAVLVLSSSVTGDGRLSPRGLERLLGGIKLVKEGWAPRLVITRLPPDIAEPDNDIKELFRLTDFGAEVVEFGPVWTTDDELAGIKQMMKARGWATVLVVTSPYHSVRVRALLQQCGINGAVIVAPDRSFPLSAPSVVSERIQIAHRIAYESVAWIKRKVMTPQCQSG